MPPLIDIGAMIKGILSKTLKLYTPKGFWSGGQPEQDWVTGFETNDQNDTVKITIECKLSELQGWLVLNARPALDNFMDLADGKDLLYLNKVEDHTT